MNSAPLFEQSLDDTFVFNTTGGNTTEDWQIDLGSINDYESDSVQISLQDNGNTFVKLDQTNTILTIQREGVTPGNYTIDVILKDFNELYPMSTTTTIKIEIQDL